MSWYWQAELGPEAEATTDDLAGAGVGQGFDDQASAEGWLTQAYPLLADLGVAQVTLFEEDRLVYGPMSLSEE